MNKNNDFKTFDSNINECKLKVDLINKIKISSIIAYKKLMKSIVEKNSKKDKKWFKFNYNKQCIYKTKYIRLAHKYPDIYIVQGQEIYSVYLL